ncbi:MAG TPA: cation transporter [Syntrophorhabdales bacterium]|nr:cation transporter [Syntrophorhabdales bacterium]
MNDLRGKALRLSYLTVGYNIIEGVVSVAAGILSDSVALVGFGLDSFIESFSGGVMIWRFGEGRALSEEEEERVERRAAKLVAYTFFILAAYLLFESAKKLWYQEVPEPSLLGIVVAALSMIVMPALARAKFRLGRQLGSRSLVADSKETLACFFLSVALFIGLGLNYVAGLWQADPVVGLIICGYLVKEGRETMFDDD